MKSLLIKTLSIAAIIPIMAVGLMIGSTQASGFDGFYGNYGMKDFGFNRGLGSGRSYGDFGHKFYGDGYGFGKGFGIGHRDSNRGFCW